METRGERPDSADVAQRETMPLSVDATTPLDDDHAGLQGDDLTVTVTATSDCVRR